VLVNPTHTGPTYPLVLLIILGFLYFLKEIVFWMSCSYGRRMRVNVYDRDIDALQSEVEKGGKINHMS
jgi:hypothetical protein